MSKHTTNQQNPWQQKSNSTVAGRNIYQSDTGKNVLYNKKTKTGYVIREKDEKAFRLYHNRYAITVAVFMLCYGFIPNVVYTAIIAIGFAIVLEIKYRKNFLPSLPRIENFKPRNQISLVDGIANTHEKKRCVLLMVLYLALGILMVVNGYQTNHSTTLLVMDYLICGFTTYMAIIYILAIKKM